MGGWGVRGGVRGGAGGCGGGGDFVGKINTRNYMGQKIIVNLKYLSSARAPTSAIGTMGTTNPDYGGVGMGAGARPRVAANLFTNFDFSTPKIQV